MTDDVNEVKITATTDAPTDDVKAETPMEAPPAAPTGDIDWKGSLSEELRGDDILKDVGSIEDLAKGYAHAQRAIGGMVRIPGEDAGEEQRDAFYKRLETVPGVTRINEEDLSGLYDKLGRPESSEKYEIKLDIDPELWDNAKIDKFKDVAHGLGLNNVQLNKLLEFEKTRIDEYVESFEVVRDNCTKTLRSEWGDGYDSRLAGAKAAINVFADKFPDDIKDLVGGPAGNNPAFLAIMAELGSNMQESGHPGLTTSQKYGMTPQDAKDSIAEIQGNGAHPYNDRSNPAHEAAVLKMAKLYESAFPGAQ